MDKPKQETDEIDVKLKPDDDAYKAAQEMVRDYQGSIDRIREGRYSAGSKLIDLWTDWKNNLMTISFGLGGALLALTSSEIVSPNNAEMLYASATLLILNGLYILLHHKKRLEEDSVQAVSMGYELEYYSLVARNRVQDTLVGKPFKLKEYEDAKTKMLNNAVEGIDKSYEESGRVEEQMDIATTVFLLSMLLLVLSTITSTNIQIAVSITGLFILLGFLIVFRESAIKSRRQIKERNKWLTKMKPERTRHSLSE